MFRYSLVMLFATFWYQKSKKKDQKQNIVKPVYLLRFVVVTTHPILSLAYFISTTVHLYFGCRLLLALKKHAASRINSGGKRVDRIWMSVITLLIIQIANASFNVAGKVRMAVAIDELVDCAARINLENSDLEFLEIMEMFVECEKN